MAESIVTLRVEARNAISSLNRTSQATKKLSQSANGATASLTAASTAAKGLGASLAASLGPLLTVGAAFATVGNAIGTFTARERDIDILRQGLVNLGEGTAALNELQKAANRLGNQTLFNQEEFTRGFNLLTSFRNIGVDSYERVAQAAADIAQVNQVDVSTSFMQLAKALQDPERNLSNLNRSGIAFTKQQTEVIKQLMKTNKTAEAHAMILSIVEESYNKLAQAAAEGFAGNVDSLGEAFRDFSETLGQALEPVLIATVKGLTALIKAVDDLFNSPLGVTAGIFTAIAFAAKGVSVALPLVSAGLMKVAAAGGVATIALNALPFVAVATGIGAIITALVKQREAQNKVTEAIKEGEVAQLRALENDLSIKMAKEFAIINSSNDKRSIQAAEKRLAILREQFKPIRDRINEVIRENAELAKTNKLKKDALDKDKKLKDSADELKKKYMEIGESVEQGIVDNLTDAVMGTKTLAEAAINVLNNLKRKLIEVAIEKAVAGIGGKIGGFLGNIFGKRARGGPVAAGGAYLVGERGPEILQMGSKGGSIIPNNAIAGGGVTNVVTVNVDAKGSSVAGNGSEADQLGQLIGGIVQQTLVKEQRAGGLLNR